MSRTRTAILISGRGSNMSALIAAAAEASYPAEIALVLSDNPHAAGLRKAREAGVPCDTVDRSSYQSRDAFEGTLNERLSRSQVELLCLAGFMRVLSAGFVEEWRDRVINIHPSLLPVLQGLDTHQRALMAGVKIHGCTIHFVRPKVDDGPIIMQAAVPVLEDDTAHTLSARVLDAEHRIYPLALDLVASKRAVVAGNKVVIEGATKQATSRLIVPSIPES